MKTLLDKRASDPHAAQAVELFCYQLRKTIGALAAALGGLDTLVFTGGIGERAATVRCDADRVLLHGHAGGTVVFSMYSDRKAVGHIAKAAGVRALVPGYLRSPEHKFPAQTYDVEKAYHWLLAQGTRPEHIASIGHSIGGNFAVSLAVTLRDQGAPLPAAILSVSPWYDMELKNETLESNAGTDALLSRPVLEWFRESWLGGTGVAWGDPRVNMLHADLTGLPPIAITLSTID